MKDKAIDADLLITFDTNLVDQSVFVAECPDSCEEPAIPDGSLADIGGSSSVDEELRLFEDVLSTSDRYKSNGV